MESKKLIKSSQFIEEMSKTIGHIIWKSFPRLSQEEREDIAQEVKLKIWRMASRGKKIKNLRSYLWKVVYTTALDVISERMDVLRFDEIIKENNTHPISQLNLVTPESLRDKSEHKLIIEKALNSLSQNNRLVIKLYLTGMRMKEIADFLGWTESKVNHLYYRGLNELKEKFKKTKND